MLTTRYIGSRTGPPDGYAISAPLAMTTVRGGGGTPSSRAWS